MRVSEKAAAAYTKGVGEGEDRKARARWSDKEDCG